MKIGNVYRVSKDYTWAIEVRGGLFEATRVDNVFVTGRFINIVEYPGEYRYRVKWFLPGSKYFSTESEAVSLILERYGV